MFSHVLFTILLNLTVDLRSIIVIVRKRVMDLSEGEVRKFCNKLLRRTLVLEHVDGDRANWKSSAVDDGISPANGRIARDMRMGNFWHRAFPEFSNLSKVAVHRQAERRQTSLFEVFVITT